MKQRVCLAILILLFMASGSFAQSTIAVGDEAPDFELSDSHGTSYKLSDFRGDKAVVLEFFRSGGW